MIKVSIIVPVYNTSQYLRRCLDSCVYQSLQEIEIVIVNDCSPDMRDTVIMKEYEQKYSEKIRCIWNTENKKNGGARNVGILAASGEYILCVDADDYIDLDMCKELYESSISGKSDMAVCDYLLLQNGKMNEMSVHVDLFNYPFGFSSVCCVVMIKKSLIIENGLFFPENILSEDNMILLWYLAAEKISKVDKYFYYYYRRKGSSVVSNDFEAPYFTFVDFLHVVNSLKGYDFWEKINQKTIDNTVVPVICKRLYDHALRVFKRYNDKFQDYSEDVIKVLDRYDVNFHQQIFDNTSYGKLICLSLTYMRDNVRNKSFTCNFGEFYDNLQKQILIARAEEMLPYIGDKKVVFWGAGIRGKRYTGIFEEAGLEFAITDLNEGVIGKKIGQTHSVLQWDELKGNCDIVFVTPIGILDEVEQRIKQEKPEISVYDIQKCLDIGRLVSGSSKNDTVQANANLKMGYDKNNVKYGLNINENREKKIIVSLTTFPKRINYAYYVIDMMLKQTLKPDKVILVLSKEEFNDITSPDDYLNLEKRGLTILYVDGNIRSYKKYLDVMQYYPDDIVITVDDDIIYPNNLIETLYNSYTKYPQSVSAIRTHKIKYDTTGELLPYKKWMFDYCTTNEPSHDLMAIGCGGILYPPGCLHTDAFNIDKIKQLCLDADDIWLKIMELRNGTKVCCAGDGSRVISITGSQEVALSKENLDNDRNDSIIKKCMEYFGLNNFC